MDKLSPTDYPCQASMTFLIGRHVPVVPFTEAHHIVPLSWSGADVPANKINLCPQHHYSVHVILDAYVRAARPTWGADGSTWNVPAPPETKRFDKGTKRIAQMGMDGYAGTDCPGLTL